MEAISTGLGASSPIESSSRAEGEIADALGEKESASDLQGVALPKSHCS